MNQAILRVNEMDLWDLSLVKKYRKDKGLTQTELAEQANIRHATVVDWENKPLQTLDARLVGRVARALNVSPWNIIRIIDIPDDPS